MLQHTTAIFVFLVCLYVCECECEWDHTKYQRVLLLLTGRALPNNVVKVLVTLSHVQHSVLLSISVVAHAVKSNREKEIEMVEVIDERQRCKRKRACRNQSGGYLSEA